MLKVEKWSRNATKASAKMTCKTRQEYIYSGQQVVCEYEVPTGSTPDINSPAQQYVYGSYVDEPILKEDANGDVVYYTRNQQYSITALTDSSGNVVERYAYTAYGEASIFNGAGAPITTSAYNNPYTFTARRSDPETGLLYFRARYYDSELGRFIGRDPLGFIDGMSLYQAFFVPDMVDPSGKKICYCQTYKSFGIRTGTHTAVVSDEIIFSDSNKCSDNNSGSTICRDFFTEDERRAIAICGGNSECEKSIAALMNRVRRTTSGVLFPKWPFMDKDGYCFEYIKNFKRNSRYNWHGNKAILPGGCTVELLVIGVRQEKTNPATGNITTYRNYWFGYETAGFKHHGIVKVTCGKGKNRKHMYFDVGAESFTGVYGGTDKWFSPENENFLDEIDLDTERPWRE